MNNNVALEILAFTQKNPEYRAVPGIVSSPSSGREFILWAAVSEADTYIPGWTDILRFVPDAYWQPMNQQEHQNSHQQLRGAALLSI